MSDQVYMVDIETTGTDIENDEILQIAIVGMTFGKNSGLWTPRQTYFNFYQHTDKEPESDFAKKYQADLYKKCQEAYYTPPEKVRDKILAYISNTWGRTPFIAVGKNASSFDMPWLVKHGYLNPFYRDKDEQGNIVERGDFHYRVEDMTGGIIYLSRLKGWDRRTTENAALAVCPEIPMPKDVESHDGLYDCYRQIRMYNGLLKLGR